MKRDHRTFRETSTRTLVALVVGLCSAQALAEVSASQLERGAAPAASVSTRAEHTREPVAVDQRLHLDALIGLDRTLALDQPITLDRGSPAAGAPQVEAESRRARGNGPRLRRALGRGGPSAGGRIALGRLPVTPRVVQLGAVPCVGAGATCSAWCRAGACAPPQRFACAPGADPLRCAPVRHEGRDLDAVIYKEIASSTASALAGGISLWSAGPERAGEAITDAPSIALVPDLDRPGVRIVGRF